MAAALAAALLAIVLTGLPGVTGVVRQIWSALSAISALIAVIGGVRRRTSRARFCWRWPWWSRSPGVATAIARWAAIGFGVVGGGIYLSYAPPSSLVEATDDDRRGGRFHAGCQPPAGRASRDHDRVVVEGTRWSDAGPGSAAVIVYAVTAFTVTAGVLVGGENGGFFAGHMAATICWIAMAAALFVYAARLTQDDRSLPIGGGLALVAAAMAKLFLFDLGTLDGIFRVVVFIVVGLVLLGMGAGYARLLERQDQQQDQRV